jgi:hypothetical protein
MSFVFGLAIMLIGLFLLALVITIFLTPSEIWNRNHQLAQAIKNGEKVESDYVDTVVGLNPKTGQVVTVQQLKNNAIKYPYM